MKDDDQRIYRAAFLRADEAEYLNQEANNRIAKPCCEHLGTLHHQQDRPDGSWWRTCQILGCGCLEDAPPSALYLLHEAQDKEYEKRGRWDAHFAFLFLGLILGGALMRVIS